MQLYIRVEEIISYLWCFLFRFIVSSKTSQMSSSIFSFLSFTFCGQQKVKSILFFSKFICSSIIIAVIMNGFKMNLKIFFSFLPKVFFNLDLYSGYSPSVSWLYYFFSLPGQFAICVIWSLLVNCLSLQFVFLAHEYITLTRASFPPTLASIFKSSRRSLFFVKPIWIGEG